MRRFVSTVVTLLVLFMSGNSFAEERGNPIAITFYESPRCKHCQNIKKELIPRLMQKYKDVVTLIERNTTQEDALQEFIALCEEYHANPLVPAFFVDLSHKEQYLFVGSDNIENNIFSLIDDFLAEKRVNVRQKNVKKR